MASSAHPWLDVPTLAARPELLTAVVSDRPDLRVRPLMVADARDLAEFLASLSEQTRQRWHLPSYDYPMAVELCAAIGRYDKVRLVVLTDEQIVALLEFSLDVPLADLLRFASYGITLGPIDCRFGPCVRDDFQRRGIASALMPTVLDVARRFGRRRIILWGGVRADNGPALGFYRKHGFVELGSFRDPTLGVTAIDMILNVH